MTVLWISLALTVAFAMEGWAALLHRFAWHGSMWFIHCTHHDDEPGFELNDLLALSHALPASWMVYWGAANTGLLATVSFGIGLGMTLFGAAYATIHDGYVHERLPLGFLGKFRWMRRIKAAHKLHHHHDGAPFGLFSGPLVIAWSKRQVSRSR